MDQMKFMGPYYEQFVSICRKNWRSMQNLSITCKIVSSHIFLYFVTYSLTLVDEG
jgi:hypothetical protein